MRATRDKTRVRNRTCQHDHSIAKGHRSKIALKQYTTELAVLFDTQGIVTLLTPCYQHGLADHSETTGKGLNSIVLPP